jgi:hypothetical protein
LDKGKLNRFAIEMGRANIQFWGWNDTWGGQNYGIPSGTYTPHVYVLGYIEKGPLESVSVTLSGDPTSVSDHMYRGAGFNITVFSIDWQRPRVSRNWVWGNPVGYTGAGFATSVGSDVPGDPRHLMVGEEIDIGIFQNSSLVDFVGDEPTALQDTVLTSCLFQSQLNSSIQMCGGGWNAQLRAYNGTYVNYQGNSNDAYFGDELKNPGDVGGEINGFLYFETSGQLFGPAHFNPSNVQDGGTYNSGYGGYSGLYPTAMPTGQYDLRAYTYGYVQDKNYSIYVSSGQVADMKINLVIGVNVTLDILFKNEQIITPTSGNMSARVRLFDEKGNLVAEWMSSEGTYIPTSGFARAADGTNSYPFGPLHPAVPVSGPITSPTSYPLNTYNYLPGGVTLLRVLMAGLPQVPAAGTDGGPSAPFVPQQIYFNDPLLVTTTCGFQLNCYVYPGTSLGVGVPGYFPNTGIMGAPSYQGGWTAEVDFVNLYPNNTGLSTCFAGVQQCGNYYPPVAGLLLGESYHVVPGTTAKSGISLAEDLALNIGTLGHGMSANHLGPYSQRGAWQIAGTHNSGEASGIFEVDLNGLVSGNALAFTWSNEFRPLSWGTITVTGAGLPTSGLNFYTYDGVYQAYLPSTVGTSGSVIYTFSLNAPGYAAQTWKAAVASGQFGRGQNLYLEESNIPVSEFSSVAVVVFPAIALSLYLLRRRRR